MSIMKRLALSLCFAALFLVAALVSFPCVAGALLFLVASNGLGLCNTVMRYSRDNLRMLWATSLTVETACEARGITAAKQPPSK